MSDLVRRLRHEDIPAALRLKDAAGWNQTAQDWVSVLELEPEGCFCLESAGELAATATSVCYGTDLAWIGMVLTAPEFRGRGFARRLMEHTLAFLRGREITWIKLDATDMGRPLYAALGFAEESPIERWRGQASASPRGRSSLSPVFPEIQVGIVGQVGNLRPIGNRPFDFDPALDRQAFGADRTALLRRLAQAESESIPGQAFAMARPGTKATYFGPAVARTVDAARTLLRNFLSRHAGEPVFWDLLPENHNALNLAREFGFEPVRRLSRMSLAGAAGRPPFVHDDSLVYAVAGFEVG